MRIRINKGSTPGITTTGNQYVFPTPEPFRQHTALRTMNRLTLAHTPAPVPEQDRRVAKARAEHYAGSEPEHATPGAMG